LDKAAALPDTPAARCLTELTALMAEATPERVAAYVHARFTASYAEREPIDRRIAAFMDWKLRGGMTPAEVRASEAHRIEVVAVQPYTEERQIVIVEVEPHAPHFVSTLAVGRAPLPALVPSTPDQHVADRFIAYVDRLAAVGLFSGAVLIARHGGVLGQKAYGLASRDFGVPNSLETRFNVASLCKSWTAVAIARLAEDGCLSFEDQLSAYLDYPDALSAAGIRIKHLLSHTAGLGSYFTEEFYRTARHKIRTVDDYLALSKDQLPTFAAGTAWKYSNTGMVVLGKIIEIVTGETYFDHVQRRVLEPAGMTRSGFFELDHVNDNVAVGYHTFWSIKGPRVVNNLFENFVGGCPAGCGFATVGDVFLFAEALKAGRLVSPTMADLLTRAKPELGAPDYGYGFSIHPERALYGHSGGLVGASANLDIVEQPHGWVIAVLANDLGMRTPALKARQLIGVTVDEAAAGRAYVPTAGVTER